MRFGIACLGAALSLAACSTVLESTVDLEQEGVVYHLPRTLIELYIRPKAIYDQEKDTNAQSFFVGSNQFYMTATSTTIPDTNQRYVLKYIHNVLYNDRVCVSSTNTGMLNSIEIATEDATPQIVVALASLAATLSLGAPGPVSAGPVSAAPQPEPVRVTFDPYSPNQVAAAAQVISDRLLLPPSTIDTSFLRNLPSNGLSSCDGKGVCFRTSVKMPLALRLRDSGGRYIQASPTVYVDVVNMNHMGHMDLERAFLVEKLIGLGFTNGALTHVITRRPSETLQAVKLPLAVVDAILAVPGNLLARANSGNSSVLNALSSEAKARADTLTQIQGRLDAISKGLSTRPDGTSTEASVFQVKCNGTLNPAKG